ncbi:hypothetical protein Aduo_013420 [Ancylostoma duodenale]
MEGRVVQEESSECQENEEFVECSRRCELNCNIPIWEGCEFSGPCVSRCECKEGYARNQEDKCVPEEECLSVPCDDPNEVRKRQGLKDFCRPTCEYRNLTESCDVPKYLSFVCECKPGYILDEVFGKCVPIEECKTEVPCNDPNEVRKLRGLDLFCRPTCDYRNSTELCDEPRYLRFACECKPGYVLDDIFGKCVPTEECKIADLPIQTTTQISENTETSGKTETHKRNEMPETSGMAKTEKPIVPEESSCQENEVFVECSRKCESRCHIPTWDCCELSGPCYPRCECKPGYARNQEDKCVPEEECLSGKCVPSELKCELAYYIIQTSALTSFSWIQVKSEPFS